jgi:hypothetical protein
MATSEHKKLGNLQLVRGGRYASACTNVEIAMERECRQRASALRRIDGTAVRDRTVSNIAGDVVHPTRFYARLFRRLKAKKVSYQAARALAIQPLERGLAQVYGRTTGEFRPAA